MSKCASFLAICTVFLIVLLPSSTSLYQSQIFKRPKFFPPDEIILRNYKYFCIGKYATAESCERAMNFDDYVPYIPKPIKLDTENGKVEVGDCKGSSCSQENNGLDENNPKESEDRPEIKGLDKNNPEESENRPERNGLNKNNPEESENKEQSDVKVDGGSNSLKRTKRSTEAYLQERCPCAKDSNGRDCYITRYERHPFELWYSFLCFSPLPANTEDKASKAALRPCTGPGAKCMKRDLPNPSCGTETVIKFGVSIKEMSKIVYIHNDPTIRDVLWKHIGVFSASDNMREMGWDYGLAEQAQAVVNHCDHQHECLKCLVPDGTPGQLLVRYVSDRKDSVPSVEGILYNMFSKLNDNVPSEEKSSEGDSTSQLEWSKRHKVGCGMVQLEHVSTIETLIACNYQPRRQL